ncbi:MAG: M28 family peptidase [Lentisphaeria bacterium]|nr:M28 family peptidase [Lentisphaeria bacterium]
MVASCLVEAGFRVSETRQRVQAFRCDRGKPLHHWYARPEPTDPWYDAFNVEGAREGRDLPGEIIQLVSHKDSMSWIDSPGALDNGVGTVANMELARVLAKVPLRRTVRILFCNEEHTPWTSRAAAESAARRGDHILAVLNQDSLTGKSDRDAAQGRRTHAVAYSTEEGRALAHLLKRLHDAADIGLDLTLVHKERVNDDDGMFIQAGFRTTVMNVGSFPYADSQYHLEGDRPERVDIDNLVRSARLVLAAVLALDAEGEAALRPQG